MIRLLHYSRWYNLIGSRIFLLGYKENSSLFTWIKARNNIHSSCSWLAPGFYLCIVFKCSIYRDGKNGIRLVDLVSAIKILFCEEATRRQQTALSYSKQQQNNSQIWEFSTQTIILPQSLSDLQYLGDTGYHKQSFCHFHLEVSKHQSAWETDVLSFLNTTWRCGSPALFVWLLYSELILFPWHPAAVAAAAPLEGAAAPA